jgi:hypothetical protein
MISETRVRNKYKGERKDKDKDRSEIRWIVSVSHPAASLPSFKV